MPQTHCAYYIGLMSGTSMDGVDGVIINAHAHPPQVLHAHHTPMPPALRQALLDLNSPGHNELHRSALAANQLVQLYAQTVDALLAQSQLTAQDIQAIGAHGQTVRHCPHTTTQKANAIDEWTAYTLQLNNPALLAELTQITVIADFRSRDVAAGGQGAPLVPAFHQTLFQHPHQTVAVVNIGGMANATILQPNGQLKGFDTGPGNVLSDLWCELHTHQPFDRNGQWAAQGTLQPDLLNYLLQHEPYFLQQGARSTGRDLFNLHWLQHLLAQFNQPVAPVDVQTTLIELTAHSIVQAIAPSNPQHLWVCGGGVYNACLMQRLSQWMACPVQPTDAGGMPAMQVEAAAFAWLAACTHQRQTNNSPSVTGALGTRILGAVYF